MPQDPSFRKFIEAIARQRKGVADLEFPAFEGKVGASARATSKLLAEAKKTTSPQRRACIQQALDMMKAAERAIDMRNMTHKDYMQAYSTSQISQERYEKSRLARFESGRY